MPANPADSRAGSAAECLFVGGKSVRGASHIREKLPNQDAIGWLPADGYGWPICLAVADGHGSPKCFRSAAGSKLAVEAMLATLSKFARQAAEQIAQAEMDSSQSDSGLSFNVLSVLKSGAQQQLPQGIVRDWRKAVEQHLKLNPFTEAELTAVEEASGAGSRAGVAANPILTYGSTVMGVLVTPDFSLYLQLGDGDILLVAADGEISPAVPHDDRLLANETTSLSMEQPWRDFRVTFQIAGASPPELVLVSTDGCANSFRSHDDFLKIGGDILTKLQNTGLPSVIAELEPWLNQLSAQGSGDDITFGIIYRNSSERPPRRTPASSGATPSPPVPTKLPSTPPPKQPISKPDYTPPPTRPRRSPNDEPPFYIGFVRQAVHAWNTLRGWLGTGLLTMSLLAVVVVLVLIGRSAPIDDEKNRPTVEISEVVPERPVPGFNFQIKLTGKHSSGGPLRYEYRQQTDKDWTAAEGGVIQLEKIAAPPGSKVSLMFRSLAEGQPSATLEQEWTIRANTAHRLTAQPLHVGPSRKQGLARLGVNFACDDAERDPIQKVEYRFPEMKWTEFPTRDIVRQGNILTLGFDVAPSLRLRSCEVRVGDAYGIWSQPLIIPLPPLDPGRPATHHQESNPETSPTPPFRKGPKPSSTGSLRK